MSKLIKVYFNNGNTAIYNADRVSFRCDPPTRETIKDLGSIRVPSAAKASAAASRLIPRQQIGTGLSWRLRRIRRSDPIDPIEEVKQCSV